MIYSEAELVERILGHLREYYRKICRVVFRAPPPDTASEACCRARAVPPAPPVQALGVWGSGLCAVAALSQAGRRVRGPRCFHGAGWRALPPGPGVPSGWDGAGFFLLTVTAADPCAGQALRWGRPPGWGVPCPQPSAPCVGLAPSVPAVPSSDPPGRKRPVAPRQPPPAQAPTPGQPLCLFCPLTGVGALQHLAGRFSHKGNHILPLGLQEERADRQQRHGSVS